MAASGPKFNRHRQTAETLPTLTSDYSFIIIYYTQEAAHKHGVKSEIYTHKNISYRLNV